MGRKMRITLPILERALDKIGAADRLSVPDAADLSHVAENVEMLD